MNQFERKTVSGYLRYFGERAPNPVVAPRRRLIGAVAAFVVLMARPAAAQTDTQIWSEMSLSWIRSHALTFSLDVEPKWLVSKSADEPGWSTLDLTPSVELTRGNWFDMTGELRLARTRQTDHQDSWEVSPRIGLRFHLLANIRDDLVKEKRPTRRLVLRSLFRVEWRNLHYSDDTPPSSTVRVRDRIELQFPINRSRITDNGAWYATSDAEWFWTHTDPAERFANKQRVRAGLGQRWNYSWRTELLAVWDRSRDSAHDGFTTADIAADVRVTRVW